MGYKNYGMTVTAAPQTKNIYERAERNGRRVWPAGCSRVRTKKRSDEV